MIPRPRAPSQATGAHGFVWVVVPDRCRGQASEITSQVVAGRDRDGGPALTTPAQLSTAAA